jgi:non-homologous end joining protein Ku
VIREAIRKEGMVAIGKVVFTSREHNEDALKDLLRKKQEG